MKNKLLLYVLMSFSTQITAMEAEVAAQPAAMTIPVERFTLHMTNQSLTTVEIRYTRTDETKPTIPHIVELLQGERRTLPVIENLATLVVRPRGSWLSKDTIGIPLKDYADRIKRRKASFPHHDVELLIETTVPERGVFSYLAVVAPYWIKVRPKEAGPRIPASFRIMDFFPHIKEALEEKQGVVKCQYILGIAEENLNHDIDAALKALEEKWLPVSRSTIEQDAVFAQHVLKIIRAAHDTLSKTYYLKALLQETYFSEYDTFIRHFPQDLLESEDGSDE